MRWYTPRFASICLVLFVLGLALRVQAGWLSGVMAGGPQDDPAVTDGVGDDTTGARQVVLDFYAALDKGRYAEAHALVLENRWEEGADGAPVVTGLTSETEFVDSLSSELGNTGMELNIIGIDVLAIQPLAVEAQSPEQWPDLQTLQFLPEGVRVNGIYEVEVGGTLLGRCSRWNWHRVVLVAHLASEQGWKLLLPGQRTPHSPHNEEWFLDRKF